MKIISLNIEGRRHLDRVTKFLETESADIVCLIEAPEDAEDWLNNQGYQCTFAPMSIQNHNEELYTEGIMFASKANHTAEIIHYFAPNPNIVPYVHEQRRSTQRHLVLFAEVDGLYVGTTHFTWNPNAETADEYQMTDMKNMLTSLSDKPQHILCGDLNIPRYHNSLYEELAVRYKDNVPTEYFSSLDKDLHRYAQDPELQKLFNNFMVDYLFSHPMYNATDVRLEFGISDHAAVIGIIEKST